jgi:hypothetical protein
MKHHLNKPILHIDIIIMDKNECQICPSDIKKKGGDTIEGINTNGIDIVENTTNCHIRHTDS